MYELNPGFHRWATDPAGPHFLLLPRDTADAFKRNLDLLSPDERVRVSLHTVKKGETVATIAKRYKTQAIVGRDMNSLDMAALLVVGSELACAVGGGHLPAKVMLAAARGRPAAAVAPAGVPQCTWCAAAIRCGVIAKRHRMDVATLARLNAWVPATRLRAGKARANSRGSSGSSRSASSGNFARGELTRCVAATRCRE